MKSINFIKFAAILSFGLFATMGMSGTASAQGNRGYNQRQARTVSRQQVNTDHHRRGADVNRQNGRRDNDNYTGGGSYFSNDNDHYQIKRNHSSYDTDRRRDQDNYTNRYQNRYNNGRSVNIIRTILRSVRAGSRH